MRDSNNSSSALLTLKHITKTFSGFVALNNVDLEIHSGRCLGLVGHNGAGKSTLMNILSGILQPDEGDICINGNCYNPGYTTAAARSEGIFCIFQELSLCENLTVAENIVYDLRHLPAFSWKKTAAKCIKEKLEEIFPKNNINVNLPVEELNLSQKQMVEIARGFLEYSRKVRILILDEPTSALDSTSSQQLLEYINSVKEKGVSTIFISHRLDEVLACSDEIAIMSDGEIIEQVQSSDVGKHDIIDKMGQMEKTSDTTSKTSTRRICPDGANTSENYLITAKHENENKLTVKLAKSEVVGLAGLAGQGQTEFLYQLLFNSNDYKIASDCVFVAGDRTKDGVFPLWSIENNASINVLEKIKSNFLLNSKKEHKISQRWKKITDLKTNNLKNGILSLSGGNQQKVLFARALEANATIVLMDDPTRGVDVGTKRDIYSLIEEETEKGRSFMWYSTEIDELYLCDRVYVFLEDEIVAELKGDEISEKNILSNSFVKN